MQRMHGSQFFNQMEKDDNEVYYYMHTCLLSATNKLIDTLEETIPHVVYNHFRPYSFNPQKKGEREWRELRGNNFTSQ